MRPTRIHLHLQGLPPRIRPTPLAVRHADFLKKHEGIQAGQRAPEGERCVIRGRVSSIRSASSKLHFVDVKSGEDKIQTVALLSAVTESPDGTRQGGAWQVLHDAVKSLNKGDHVEVLGVPGRTATGELSVFAQAVTKLSTCRHRIPEQYNDVEKRLRNRHLDFMVNRSSRDVLRTRSRLVSGLRRFLEGEDFMEVETPMLSSSASGATARPFVTRSEILDRSLQLRIAPELALKRAVLAGFERVFEIGKCFRNEGLSKKHNPEFTTCEFYAAYWGIEDLVLFTERLLRHLESLSRSKDDDIHGKPLVFDNFQHLDFLSTLQSRLGVQRLPGDDDLEGMSALLQSLGLPAPSLSQVEHLDHAAEFHGMRASVEVALPEDRAQRALLMADSWDKLSTLYLEPLAKKRPTFILSPPSILAPLAKSTEPASQSPSPSSLPAKGGQRGGIGISHRFELYVQGMELVNAYEEENCPLEQRRKFEQQRLSPTAAPANGGPGKVTRAELTAEEESYCKALEYGLPPTAGWGMGIDRLVMVLTGAKSINEVLLAGGLRYQAGSG